MFDCAGMQAICRRIVRPPTQNRPSHPPGQGPASAEMADEPRPLFHHTFARMLASAGLMLSLIAPLSQAHAQESVLSRGDAVVTGFSGIKPSDVPLKPGANPLDEFFIDLNGPSAQILSLAVPGGAPSGQLISAPAKLRLKASQIGQVFAAALDDGQGGKVPSIYLGATSAYGLNIAVPDADGDGWPERVKSGQPGAQWMAGQFGDDLGGGPGSIYKVDGQNGAVSLFATLPDNGGPGIGDIVFDKASRQFFASDLDKGLIYRLGESGEMIDSFDHGVAGRPAKGLAPVSDDGKEADIENAAFNSENPESWGATQEERRVHGLAVQDGRLYYAVDGQVWSIGISAEGFAKDARWELNVEGLPGEGPITDMLFDREGRLYLAQRGHQRASYDYSLFAEPEKSAVARYAREEPDNPATDSVWIAEPESYAIGLPPEHHHAEGGIALGYPHDETGALRYGACGEMLWSTGHRLRQSAIAQSGEGEGEADVHGLQGNAVSLVRPENVPPRQSYFADHDGFFGDAAKAGHMGDVEIWQPCEGVSTPQFGSLPPGIFPPGDMPPDLPPEYPPEYEFETNLKLVKRAMPKTCLPWAGGWLCRYQIRVTNTGPDNYFGPVMVDDWLPAHPAGAVIGFAPTPPWVCWNTGPSAYRCLRFGVFLAPSWSIDLTAYAWVPKAYDKCNLRNVAAIQWAPGGSRWNSDPTDDEDDANALIPAPNCPPKGDKTDLKIYKRAMSPCFAIAGDKVRCAYRVTVENQGPGAYNGNIVVKDTIPAGTAPAFSGPPGWGCVVAAPVSTCTYAGASLPNMGDSVSFIVRLDMSRDRARQLHCKAPNEVEITGAAGGTAQNTDPANDTAIAVADVPDAVCIKPLKTNLRIGKRASPEFCGRSGNDWWCSYLIRIWNMGPGAYNGPLEVEEALPAQPLDAAWSIGWNCVGMGGGGGGATCTHPNTVIPPLGWRTLILKVKFAGDVVKDKNCLLPNVAKIKKAAPGTDKNTNPGDDIAGDTAKVPAWFCKQPPPEPANLELRKHGAQLQCNIENGKWRCPYNVVVKNTGPGKYKGEIVVKDWLPAAAAGATMDAVAPWTCGDNMPPTVTCTHPYTELAPQQQVVMPIFFYISPSNYESCSLLNTARILKAPGGSVRNTNAGDDQASASLNFPPLLANGKTYCYSPEPNTPCPPGFRWGGQSCDRIGITMPPPPNRTCLPGFIGAYPDCEPVTGDAPDCPPGSVGDYPNCRKGDPAPECTDGRVRRASRCVCPGSLVWNGDQCVRRKCPEGTRGIFPNCKKVIIGPPKTCKKGTAGRWPDCEKIVKICPPGTVGKYPNCRKIPKHCPSNMAGKPPRCRPIVRVCPPGTFGRPPHCNRIKLRKPNFEPRLPRRPNGNGPR